MVEKYNTLTGKKAFIGKGLQSLWKHSESNKPVKFLLYVWNLSI